MVVCVVVGGWGGGGGWGWGGWGGGWEGGWGGGGGEVGNGRLFDILLIIPYFVWYARSAPL